MGRKKKPAYFFKIEKNGLAKKKGSPNGAHKKTPFRKKMVS